MIKVRVFVGYSILFLGLPISKEVGVATVVVVDAVEPWQRQLLRSVSRPRGSARGSPILASHFPPSAFESAIVQKIHQVILSIV